jgi:hypothetical protein
MTLDGGCAACTTCADGFSVFQGVKEKLREMTTLLKEDETVFWLRKDRDDNAAPAAKAGG